MSCFIDFFRVSHGIHQDYAVNSWYTGIVLRLSPYGAFVAVKSGSGWAEGLVKTNQIQGDDLEVAAEVWMEKW